MRHAALISALLLAAGTGAPAAQAPQTSRASYFEADRLIVGDGTVLEDAAFVVRDGRFGQVGRRGKVEVPGGSARVRLSGKTVMPLLVDIHTHVGFGKDGVFAAENYTRDNIIDGLRRFEDDGVGAALSLGTDMGPDVMTIRDEQRRGTAGGARLFFAGRGFVAPGGGPTVAPLQHVPYEVDRPALARILVRDNAARKVDMIKIWVDDRLHTVPKLAPDVYRAIIDEAHKQGLRVMAHVFYLEDAKDLVRAGVDGFAHLVRDQEVDDEFVSMVKAANVFICAAISPHSSPTETWIDDPALAETVPEAVRAKFRPKGTAQPAADGPMSPATLLPRMHRSIQKLNAAGVRFAFGTDTVLPARFYGFNEHLELEGLVAAGLSPLQVLTLATGGSAAMLGMKDAGTIAAGKRADFLVMNANPLESIKNTRRIADVYRSGRAVDRARLRLATSK